MEVDRPAPGEELNTAQEVTVPRQAASVIVVRGGAEALEVLLVQRTPQARFMGGYWVFPGGAVDAHEGEGDAAHRAAAVRELAEEAAITGIDPAGLVKFSQWITPREIAIRFDTHFFLAPIPEGQEPVVDGIEIVDLQWL
nr:NUDIX hydrolase [Solirubrobacteraceae bacterium]